MWFIFALATTVSWGVADLFYKKGADYSDKYSHLKIAIIVGIVMGIHAFITLHTKGIQYDPINIMVYLPVSMMYILSMIIGYCGLKYLELSILSPIQNSSGAVTCILCLVLLGQVMGVLSSIGVILICLGIFLLGVFERRRKIAKEDKKYSKGIVAFIFPIMYCVIDAIGTFFDAYYLDDYTKTPLVGVNELNFEDVANISYELTFFLIAILLFIFVKFIKKQNFGFFAQKDRITAAMFETAGQATYVYAMCGYGIVAAPMIASYSIVSLILSRIFLKEKLEFRQYTVIVFVIIGIVLLGIAENL